MTTASSTPLLIVSFHRSGSSLTAHMFHAAGLHLGDSLLGAKPSNPYGHFEDTSAIAFHDRLLRGYDHAWHRDRGPVSMADVDDLGWIKNYVVAKMIRHKAFGVKDPRLCLTIRHWQAALGRVNVVFIYRNAMSSITSLWTRALNDHRAGQARALNEILVNEPDMIARIFAHNVTSFLSWYASLPEGCDNVTFVAYDDIVSGRRNIVDEAREKWGYALRSADVNDFFDGSAVTSSGEWSVGLGDEDLSERIGELDGRLMELCAA